MSVAFRPKCRECGKFVAVDDPGVVLSYPAPDPTTLDVDGPVWLCQKCAKKEARHA